MIKIFYVVLSLVLLNTLIYAKESKEKSLKEKAFYQVDWEKIYGGKEDDKAYGIVALENGDSAIIGTCKSYNAKRTDICLTRMTTEGKMRWRLWLGGAKKENGKAIARSADGNLLILGNSKSFSKNYDYDLYVAKVSLDGKLMWEKSLGGNRDEFAGGIAGTDDGGALIVGDSESFGNGDKNIYIVKLTKDGKIVSEQSIGGEKDDSATSLTRTKNGNFVLVGYREVDRSGDKDFFIMKLTQDGKKIWANTYGGEEADSLHGVTATVDGGIVAIGKTRSYGSKQTDLTVMKFNIDGKLIWHKIYGFKYYEYGNAVATTRDGGFILTGGTNTLGKGNHSAYVLALNRDGELTWSHVYGDERKDIAHGVARMSDGSIIIVGESESFTQATNFYMIKLYKK